MNSGDIMATAILLAMAQIVLGFFGVVIVEEQLEFTSRLSHILGFIFGIPICLIWAACIFVPIAAVIGVFVLIFWLPLHFFFS